MNLEATTSLSDPALIARIQLGEESAIALLFDLHSPTVYSVALSVLDDCERAEDVLHETFMQLWREPHSFLIRKDSVRGSLALTALEKALALRKVISTKVRIDVTDLTTSAHTHGSSDMEMSARKRLSY